MTWVVTILLAVASFIAIAFLLKAPRSGWEAIGAALLLGIAGYGLQASPGYPGAPKEPAQDIEDDPAALVEARGKLSGENGGQKSNWLVVADGFARNGQYANAAGVLLGAVEENPNDGEAWLAMANSLVAHADGLLTPASFYAFRKAGEAAPDNPGAPFFLGLAMAQSGRFMEARSIWSDLLERSSDDAPWREDLESRLGQLDGMIASQGGAPMPVAPGE